jgi:HlyD family secretion protein
MATIATPRKRARFGRKWWIIGGAIVVLAIIGAMVLPMLGSGAQTAANATPGWSTMAASTGSIDASVSATGNVEAKATAELRFASDGVVTEILVKPGDKVQAGQALARLDATDFQLKIEQAQADLAQAQADEQKLRDKATPQEIAAAEARVTQAQGQYQQAAGSVTRSDIEAARAKLDAAKARLASLEAGHTGTSDAERALQDAQSRLAAKRDQLSLDKTNAEIALKQRVNDLTKAQAAYSTALQNWQYVQDTGRDPINPSTQDAQGKSKPNHLNDAQRQQYYEAYVQAESALRTAESAVQQAQVAYDAARAAEVQGIQDAEREVAGAQSKLDAQRTGGETQELAAARAEVASAQAQLNQLTGANRSGNLSAAKANIEIAQAELDKLTIDPNASDLTRAQAAVARAEATVKMAERELDQATLKAPFPATVASVDLRVGERAGQNGVIAVADLSGFHIDVPVDELDVAQIAAGQKVRLALDAMPGKELTGTVANVDPLATKSEKGTNTYNVTVAIDAADPAIKPGMTAVARIVTQSKSNAVLVPRRAVQSENGQTFVLIPTQGQPARDGTPASERREVTLGLSNNESVEITSGLAAGEQVLIKDVVSTFNPQQPQ